MQATAKPPAATDGPCKACQSLTGEPLLYCLATCKGGQVLGDLGNRLNETEVKKTFAAIAGAILDAINPFQGTNCGAADKRWLAASFREWNGYPKGTVFVTDKKPGDWPIDVRYRFESQVICCGDRFRDELDAEERGLDDVTNEDLETLCSGPRAPW